MRILKGTSLSTRPAVTSALIALFTLGGLVAGSIPGMASPLASAPHGTEIQIVPMVLRGYDVAVANQHGFKIVQENGRLGSVKVADHPFRQDPAMAPLDEPVVHGDCGTAFMYFAAQGDRKAQVYTGFDLTTIAPMVGYSWAVSVTDNAGVQSNTWGGPDVGYSWDVHWTTSHSTTGYATAKVTAGSAVLADGGECVAGLPWQSTILY